MGNSNSLEIRRKIVLQFFIRDFDIPYIYTLPPKSLPIPISVYVIKHAC